METPSEVVARRLREVRESRRLSVRDLAAELKKIGYKLLPSGLSKIENRERQVSVADLLALSVALGVTPLALLTDVHAPEAQPAPGVRVLPYELLMWALGRRPLGEPLNLEIGEYQPPGLVWGEMQPDALLAESIDQAWRDVQNWHNSARPQPFGAPTEEARSAAVEQVSRGVASLRSLLDLAAQRGIAVPPDIAAYVTEHGGDRG